MDIFSGKKLTKIEAFKNNLRTKVLAGQIKNNFDALTFAYDEGHIAAQAAECLRDMKKNQEIAFDGTSPLITYSNVYTNYKKVEYIIKGK